MTTSILDIRAARALRYGDLEWHDTIANGSDWVEGATFRDPAPVRPARETTRLRRAAGVAKHMAYGAMLAVALMGCGAWVGSIVAGMVLAVVR